MKNPPETHKTRQQQAASLKMNKHGRASATVERNMFFFNHLLKRDQNRRNSRPEQTLFTEGLGIHGG
jgi:hypothetical protein